ncbi:MAG: ribonuclease HI [Planctomycetes bacterium]|nr:ribonuclease HI [Planctomycetota bacterium]
MPTHATTQADKRAEVELFTDGACSGNPGPGGWAYILKHQRSGQSKKDAGAEANTTNNRMELTAVIKGLEALRRPTRVRLVTDSEYVAKGMRDWMPKWKARGWRRGSKPVKNEDLWRRLDELLSRHQLTYQLVLGHTGHPENEECDRLAVEAYQRLMAGR